MAASETVAWVKPPDPIRGLDHLGVQAPWGLMLCDLGRSDSSEDDAVAAHREHSGFVGGG